MNSTGLRIALYCALGFGIVFGLFSGLDLWLARLFFDPVSGTFPLKSSSTAEFFRQAAMWIAWAFAVPSIVAIVFKLAVPRRKLAVSARAALFLIVTITLSAGIFSNGIFKSHWGRPRPVMVTEFGGQYAFKPWWNPAGTCPRNCSFYSGEAATAFWTYAPAALAPVELRPLAYGAATVFGLATGIWRMAFGGHFFTDVIFAGIATFLIIWLTHGLIYRWPATRLSDERIEAGLTHIAMPGYRWLKRKRDRAGSVLRRWRDRMLRRPRSDIPA